MHVKLDCKANRATLTLSGKFIFTARAPFTMACQQVLRQATVRHIDIDFAQVDFLDRTALGLLRLFKAQASAAGKQVTLIHCKGLVLTIMQVEQLDLLFNLENPVELASIAYA